MPPTPLTNFRFTPELRERLDEARYALRHPTIAAVVRTAIDRYLEVHKREIERYRRLQKRNAEEARP